MGGGRERGGVDDCKSERPYMYTICCMYHIYTYTVPLVSDVLTDTSCIDSHWLYNTSLLYVCMYVYVIAPSSLTTVNL